MCYSAEDLSHVVPAGIPAQVTVETQSVPIQEGHPLANSNIMRCLLESSLEEMQDLCSQMRCAKTVGMRPRASQAPHNPSFGLDCPAGYDQVMTFKLKPYYAVCINVQLAKERCRPILNMT